jgi:hypothetical protein
MKNPFVELMGNKHFMGCIPVQIKCLKKQRKEPVRKKEN